jgi:hypothetical protein
MEREAAIPFAQLGRKIYHLLDVAHCPSPSSSNSRSATYTRQVHTTASTWFVCFFLRFGFASALDVHATRAYEIQGGVTHEAETSERIRVELRMRRRRLSV